MSAKSGIASTTTSGTSQTTEQTTTPVAPTIPDDDSGDEPSTSAFLNSTDWNANWTYPSGAADSADSPYPYVYSKQNVYMSRNSTAGSGNSTYLNLRAVRPDSSFVSTCQIIASQQDFLHASVRARMRVILNDLNQSPPSSSVQDISNITTSSNTSHSVDNGAVVGLFLYTSETQETETELVTGNGLGRIRYSNQPDYNGYSDTAIADASTQATLPAGLDWTDWVEHRLDWFGGVMRWWVDGVLVLNGTINAPSLPMALNLKVWINGDDYWSGDMSVGGQVTVAVE